MTVKELLILGGTSEASTLARAVLARFAEALNLTTPDEPSDRLPCPVASASAALAAQQVSPPI